VARISAEEIQLLTFKDNHLVEVIVGEVPVAHHRAYLALFEAAIHTFHWYSR
jgi:hypothetical protein